MCLASVDKYKLLEMFPDYGQVFKIMRLSLGFLDSGNKIFCFWWDNIRQINVSWI